MIIRHKKREYDKHVYRDLGWLVGEEVDVKPLNLTQGYYPDRAVVIAEYPNTILLELSFRHGKYNRMVSKSKLYCGDVYIRHRESEKTLIGDEVIKSEQQKTWNSIREVRMC